MTVLTDKQIFDAIGERRGKSLSQADVDAINAVLYPASDMGIPISALDLIKQFEGCKLTAYPDPGTGGDPWTIGWGATGAGIKKGVTWTQAQADARLVEDVRRFADGVRSALNGAATTDNQLGAMISLAYNVGLANFGGSTLLKKHKAGDHVGAAAEFSRWNRAAGKIMTGLTRRRTAEAAMYRGEV